MRTLNAVQATVVNTTKPLCAYPRTPTFIFQTFISQCFAFDILQVFDSLDKDGSGYVNENDWRRLTEDTPLAASDDTFLFIERVRQ